MDQSRNGGPPQSPGAPPSAPEPWRASAASLHPGFVLAGRYRILRYLAEGGMGQVYEAEDLELGGLVALKTLHPQVASDPQVLERFKREIQLARRVTHPNVCRIFDVGFHRFAADGSQPDIPFLSMELLQGETLAERLAREGRLSEADALPVLRQICTGLSAAHEAGVVHRDFKTGNVLLVPGSDGERAVVTDFGLARTAQSGDAMGTTLTATGSAFGTPAYMAPEQIQGGPATPATDVYALGVVLYEMVTGTLPFEGDSALSVALKRLTAPPPSPRERLPGLDPLWERVILRCLRRDPEERFQGATEVAEALESGRVTRAPLSKAKLRRWLLRGGAAVAGTAALAALVVAVYRTGHRPGPEPGPQPGPPAQKRRCVAVVGFKNLSGKPESAWLSTAFSEMLGSELALGERIRTVPGEEMTRFKQDHSITDAPAFGKETLDKVRRNLGAEYAVAGSYTALGPGSGGLIRLDVNAQDTRTGETVATVSESGTEPGLFDLVSRAGSRLRQGFGVAEAEDRALAAPSRTQDTEAAKLFAEGLARYRAYDAVGARPLLEKAAALAPEDPRIRSALADAWGTLGYEGRAREEAGRAFELSAGLPRRERLELEARYRTSSHEWPKAEALYQSLHLFYPDEPEFEIQLARCIIEGGDPRRALGLLEESEKRRHLSEALPMILFTEALAHGQLGDYPRQLRTTRRAIALAEASQSKSLLARLRLLEAWTLMRLGRLEEASEAAAVSLSLYRTLGDRVSEGQALNTTGNVLYYAGDLKGAKRRYEEAREVFRAAESRSRLCWSLNDLAGVLYLLGKPAEARRHYEEALRIAREVGDKSTEATILLNLGSLAIDSLDLPLSRRRFEEALTLSRVVEDRASEIGSLEGLAAVEATEGRRDASRKGYGQVLELMKASGAESETARIETTLGIMSQDEGRSLEALGLADGALRRLESVRVLPGQARAQALRALALGSLGRRAEAEAALQRTERLLKDEQSEQGRIQGGILLGRARVALGDARGGSRDLESLLGRAKAMGDRHGELEILLALGQADLTAGQAAEGLKRLRAVESEARSHGALDLANRAKTSSQGGSQE